MKELFHVPVSIGELIDKITILEIKAERLQGISKSNVERELSLLNSYLDESNLALEPSLKAELKDVNEALWQREDKIRDYERNQDFGESFIEIARSIYMFNDKRASIKRRINIIYGSTIIEEKSYQKY